MQTFFRNSLLGLLLLLLLAPCASAQRFFPYALLGYKKMSTKLSGSNVSVQYGETKNLKAVLKQKSDNSVVPNATITFTLDGNALGTATTDSTGTATLPYSPNATTVAVGNHTLSASFAGDDMRLASTANNTLTVKKSDTKLTNSNTGGRFGQTINLPITLTRKVDGLPLNNRLVKYVLNGTAIGQATTDSTGTATLAYFLEETIPAGKYNLVITFDGDETTASTTRTVTFTVYLTRTELDQYTVTGKPGDTVTLIGVVFRTPDKKKLANRIIKFQVDGKDVGQNVTDANGTTTLDYTIPLDMKPGVHQLIVIFEGDIYYLKSLDNDDGVLKVQ